MVKESSNFTIFGAEINGGLASMDSTESHWVFQDEDDDPSQRTANTAKENCSSSLNSVLRRCDNRMFFARQGSVSQANFMRQATIEENCSSEQATIKENCNSNLNSVIQRCDNRMFFARQGSVSQANFMRQATTEEINPAESDLPLKPSGYKGSYNDSEAPLF
ncbi:hypothetical protein ACB098_03G053400 [Castanea mollissima]